MTESDQPPQPPSGSPPPPPPGATPPPAPPGYAPPTPPGQGPPGYAPPAPGYGQPGQGYAPQAYAPQAWAPQVLLPAALADKQFADYGQRVGAWLIDFLFSLTIVGFIVNWFLMGREGERNGMTLGKQVLKIRVFREDGQPVSVGFAILRELVVRGLLFGIVGSFFFGLPGLLDLLWPLWDERKQTLHDKVVSSYVIKAEATQFGMPAPA